MKKIFVILPFLIAILFIVLTPDNSFAFEQNTLKDINEHWAEKEIETLKSLGVMNGYNGYSNPDSQITRGEFTALIARAFEIKEENISKSFLDVDKNHIFYDVINAAASKGIIGGFPDGTFRPDDKITREQIMLIVSRITDNTSDTSNKSVSFKDITKSYEYSKELSKVFTDGIILGYPDGTFKPYNNTTRAEAAKIIMLAMEKYVHSENENLCFETAYSYMINHFENIKAAKELSTGQAKKDYEYIENTYKVAYELGYTLINSIDNINFISTSQKGPFTNYVCEYNVTRSINGEEKIYRGKSDLRLISRNGRTFIFEHNSQIVEDEFINLTWDVYPSSAPSYNTDGVTAVSPTCYRVAQTQEGKSTKISDTSGLLFNSELGNAYMEYARTNGYDVWAMYKTDFTTQTASMLLNDGDARKNANNLLIKEILTHRLDGINFDFENMYESDRGAYTNHVKEISLMAHTLGAVVSVDVNKYEPSSSTWSMCYDRNSLAKYSDYIILMAYDQYYPGGKTPGPVAGLPWTESCIKLTLNEIPSDKLVLGMPFYVRIWETKNGKKLGTKSVSMDSALKQIEENNATAQYDAQHDLIKYSWTKGGKTYMLWLENAQTIVQRVRLAKKYSLAGVASWRRGLESRDVWTKIAEEASK